MKVKTNDIKVDEACYPRAGLDNEYLDLLQAVSFNQLPEIKVNKELWLIDGRHRLTVAKMSLIEELDVEVEDIPKDKILERAVELNAKHGKQLTLSEKQNLVPRLYTNGLQDTDKLALLLGVSRQFVNKYTSEVRQKEDEERNQKILELYLQGFTEKEIGEKFKLDDTTVSKLLKDLKNATGGKIQVPDPPQIGDVWHFAGCDDKYGLSGFPGRIPGQIIENLLHFYTEPFDKVVDPMVGSGTTLDVCKAMYRRYLGYDLNPVREDIEKQDIGEGFTQRAKQCDMIILDPPYYKKKDEQYTPDSIASLERNDYLMFFVKLSQECYGTIKKGGYLALIMSNYVDEENAQESVWIWDYISLFKEAKFTCVREIQCPLTLNSLHPAHTKQFRESRRMAKLARSIIVFRK